LLKRNSLINDISFISGQVQRGMWLMLLGLERVGSPHEGSVHGEKVKIKNKKI
jgi:hypothetical protein